MNLHLDSLRTECNSVNVVLLCCWDVFPRTDSDASLHHLITVH